MVAAPAARDPSSAELEFRFVSGRLCLNFIATVGWRWSRAVERLRNPDDLARWIARAGLTDDPPGVSGGVLAAARELREAIFRCAWRTIEASRLAANDVEVLNGWATRPPRAPRLGPGRAVRWLAVRPAEAALAEIARDAVLLLGDRTRDRLRKCASEDCSILFVDSSRAGRRRWCSMSGCGNRTKAARFRRRWRGERSGRRPAPARAP